MNGILYAVGVGPGDPGFPESRKEYKDYQTCCIGWLVENCGMDNEKVYKEAGNMPDEAGYFSLMIVK